MRKLLVVIIIILVLPFILYSYLFLLNSYVESEIKQANYCEKPEECVTVAVCNRPCSSEWVNTNEVKRISGLIRIQAKHPFGLACSSAQCAPKLFIPAKCLANKCA